MGLAAEISPAKCVEMCSSSHEATIWDLKCLRALVILTAASPHLNLMANDMFSYHWVLITVIRCVCVVYTGDGWGRKARRDAAQAKPFSRRVETSALILRLCVCVCLSRWGEVQRRHNRWKDRTGRGACARRCSAGVLLECFGQVEALLYVVVVGSRGVHVPDAAVASF